MKTYWDLTEKERAALTHEDVKRYEACELMAAGVLAPRPLELLPETEPQVVRGPCYVFETVDYHAPNIAFRTEDDARVFATLHPMHIVTDYGTRIDRAEPMTLKAITVRDLVFGDSYALHLAAMKELGAAKKENERRIAEHTKEANAAEKALEGLWEDWHECREKAGRVERVVSTFAEYERMAGDGVTAAKFLAKAFPREEVEMAETWSGRVLSVPSVEAA